MFGVIGDRDVLVAERGRGLNHRVDRIATVAPVAVHVEVAADVTARDEMGQRAVRRRLELVMSLTELRCDERESKGCVDLALGCSDRQGFRHPGTDHRARGASHVQPRAR